MWSVAVTDRNRNRIIFHRNRSGVVSQIGYSGGCRVRVESVDDQITGPAFAEGTDWSTVREFGYDTR